MRQHKFIVCLVIFSLFALLNGRIHNDESNIDYINLYKLRDIFHQRESSGFTTAQREFQNQMLTAHNVYRKHHCVPLLTLDDTINRLAQNYAESLASHSKFEHSKLKLGENLFVMSSSQELKDLDGVIATRVWYDEIKNYAFDKPKFSDQTGHFTQLIWKGTKQLGVGYTIVKGGSGYIMYVVAQYSPAGNVQGLYSENVLPLKC